MKQILWEIYYLFPPHILHYCRKCKTQTEYLCSGAFRVNAQKKTIDVWLIYKCTNCDTTWNLPIYERISPDSLSEDVLEAFHHNSQDMIMQYAMDAALLKRNGARLCTAQLEIHGEDLPFQGSAQLKIISPYTCNTRLSAVLRQKLGISSAGLQQLVENHCITSDSNLNILKCRLMPDTVLEVTLP